MTARPRLTLTRALLASLTVTGALVAAMVWLMLSAWERSLTATAESLQAAAAQRATGVVDDYLAHLRRAVADIERRQAVGVCRLDTLDGARACLLGSVAVDEAIAEATFTSAAGWQASAYRNSASAAPCTSETGPSGAGFAVTRRCGATQVRAAVEDPRLSTTYVASAQPAAAGRLVWSDISHSTLDADLPEPKRRVVVHVLQGLRDGQGQGQGQGQGKGTGSGALLGVLGIAVLEQQLDQALAHVRVNELDLNDPFRVFLADSDGRLISRWQPTDRLRESGEDLRIAPEDVPPPVAAALARPPGALEDAPVVAKTVVADGRRYRVSLADLPGTQDWRVGVIGPEDYYLQAPRRVRRWMAVAALAALALIGAMLALAAGAVRRGLRRVVHETGRMRQLEFAATPVATPFADVEAVLTGLERAKTAMRALGKYAPIDLVRQLYAANTEPGLGGELRELTLLFTDIKDFTSFAESLPPDRLATLLGHYFAAMTGAVTAHGGTVDKYIGDALMVMWNAPMPCADHALAACRAALACVEASGQLFASEVWRDVPPLTTRFGIHCDQVMVGHFGAPTRFSYTALGDGVNLASRLEGLNKEYGTTIILSDAIAARVKGELELRLLDRVAVKGKSQAVEIYELLGPIGGATRLAVARQYEAALARYFDRDFAAAAALLAGQLDDPPSAMLSRRCAALLTMPPPPAWNGVHAWTTK